MSNKYITKISMKQNFEACKINKVKSIELIDPEDNLAWFTIDGTIEEINLRDYVFVPRENIYYGPEDELLPW